MKKTLLLILILGVVVLGGGFFAYRGYVDARQSRFLKQARDYMAGDTENGKRKAILVLQRALRYNPKDIEACRLMAELAEASRSPSAVTYRSRVVQIQPRSLENRLALAQTSVVFREYASATNALE